MKRATPKRKGTDALKRKVAKVEVKIGGEDNDGACQWPDAEVCQVIAL